MQRHLTQFGPTPRIEVALTPDVWIAAAIGAAGGLIIYLLLVGAATVAAEMIGLSRNGKPIGAWMARSKRFAVVLIATAAIVDAIIAITRH